MKKWMLCLVLALCAALALSAASAEDVAAQPYTPNALTNALFAEAFDSGKIVTGDVSFVFTPNVDMLASSDDEKEIIDAVGEVVNAVSLSLGAGKIQDGIRLELSCLYAGANRSATADAALNLTLDGASLESSLIPGEKITAKWETLLALAGADQATIDTILSLRDAGWDAALQSVSTELQPIWDEAAQIALPYLETIVTFIDALPMDIQEDVPASYGYPAAAQEATVTCTEKQIAELIVLLTNQLEKDEVLVPLIDQLLAQQAAEAYGVTSSANLPTTADLCAVIREEVCAVLTDEERPFMLFIGVDDEGTLLYATLQHDEPDGAYELACLMLDMYSDTPSFSLDIFSSDADDNIQNGFGFGMAVTPTSEDILDFEVVINDYFAQDGTIVSMDYSLNNQRFTTDDHLPGCRTSGVMTLTSSDNTMRAVYTIENEQALTTDGGERSDGFISADVYSDSTAMTIGARISQSIAPSADGLTGTASLVYDMSDLGLDEIGLNISYHTGEYDPATSAALTETTLETVSIAEMDALKDRVLSAVISKALEVSSLLPQKILLLLGE